jgi:hypothetical protein
VPVGAFPVHWPCSKLSWELKQELRRGTGASWFVVQSLSLPGATLRHAYGPGVADPSAGQYDGRILSISPLGRALSDTRGSMVPVEYDAEFDDTNRIFASIVDGASGHMVRESVATLTLGSPKLPSRLWFEAFRGVLGSYSLESTNRWRVTVRPSTLLLNAFFPKPFVFGPDWPNADPESLAQYGPLLYGQHDSTTTTAKGAVPLVYVDTVGFRYLVCWGRALSVDAVYADGAKQSSGWSTVYAEVGGRLCTLVDFTSDQGTKSITADVRGYETIGDGTGTLIEEPTAVIRHLIANWIYNDYKTGAWYSESAAPIDPASWNATAGFLSRYNSKAARRIFGNTQRRAIDIVNEFSRSWQIRLFWTNSGKIGGRLEDYSVTALYRDDQTGWMRHDRTPFEANHRPDWENVIDRVSLDHHYQEAAGKYLYALEVRDPSLPVENPDSLQLPWSAVTTY